MVLSRNAVLNPERVLVKPNFILLWFKKKGWGRGGRHYFDYFQFHNCRAENLKYGILLNTELILKNWICVSQPLMSFGEFYF